MSEAAIASVLRAEGGRIVAVLARSLDDLGAAEEALQDASVAALEVWPRTGTPRDPAAWLYVAARRKALDQLRREQRRGDRELEATRLIDQVAPELPPVGVVRDDQLRLLFTCCHPGLDLDARVALALRTLCGLSTVEVARVLLVPETTMAKRLTRARQKVTRAHIPLRVPAADDLPERVAGVCAVVHLAYTAGHAAGAGDQLVRDDLCDESRRLALLLVDLLGEQPGVTPATLASAEGLLALLLLTDARRSTRTDRDGALVRLADQDRSRWDHDLIARGRDVLQRSLRRSEGRADTYQLQAAIALCHDEAPAWSDTDHVEVLRLYRILQTLHPNPVVDTNAAAANLEVGGPDATLADLDAIPVVARRHAWHTTHAEALLRGGRPGAREAFELAAASAPTAPEREHLLQRAAAAST